MVNVKEATVVEDDDFRIDADFYGLEDISEYGDLLDAMRDAVEEVRRENERLIEGDIDD